VKKKQFHNFIEVRSQLCLRPLPVADIFSIILSRFQRYGKSQFQHLLNNFLIIGFRAKNSIARVKEVIPNESGNVHVFDILTYISRLNQGHDAYFRFEKSVT
jgi:hypothetical protein